MPSNQVKLTFSGVDRVSAVLKKMQTNMVRLGKSADRAGKKMKNIGRKMARNISAPIGLAGAAIIKTGVDFQRSMNTVEAVTKATGKPLEDLTNKALELGRKTEFSSKQAADAMVFLGRAGFKSNQILGITPNILNLASAAGSDLAFTSDTMAKTIKQFGLEAKDSETVANVLASVTRETNVSLETLAETFVDAGPIARSYGLSLQQTAALTGLLGDAGIQGSKAGTALKNIMLKLAAPTGAAAKALEILDIQVSKGKDGMVDVGTIISDLGPKLGKLPKRAQLQVLNELFGLRGIAGASALMARALDEGRNPAEALTEVLKNSTDVAKDMRKTMQKGAVGALSRFRSALEGLALSIANSGLLEKFASALDWLSKLFGQLGSTGKTALFFGVVVAGIAAIFGPFLILLGSMITSMVALGPIIMTVGSVALPIIGTFLGIAFGIGKVVLGVTALIGLAGVFMGSWSGLGEFFSTLWTTIKQVFFDKIAGAIGYVSEIAGSLFGGSSDAAAKVGTAAIGKAGTGKVDVNFSNAPAGTKVSSSGDAVGSTSLSRGRALGAQ